MSPKVPGSGPAEAHDGPETALAREQLEQILASTFFRNSQRRTDLLRWLVERVLAGESSPLKEHQIGIEVFGRRENWDPRIDPIVRVEFNRVRQKLAEYYAAEGSADPVLIDFSGRGYVPIFTARPVETPIALEEIAVSAPVRPVVRRRWIWPVAIGLAALGGLALALVAGHGTSIWQAKPSVIAVLPFTNLSDSRQNEYLSDGLTDELTNELATLPGLSTVGRASAFQFKGKAGNLSDIGKALHAGYIVEGSVERSGDSVRINASLEKADDGLRMWAQTYSENDGNVLKVEEEIVRSIASALRVKFTGSSTGEQ